MPIQILMPALSPTMTDGKIVKWVKKEGDAVESGDVIAEIETDKATMELEAIDGGILGKIIVPDGSEGVAVNATIAVLLEEGEDASAMDAIETAPVAPVAAPPAVPEAAPVAPEVTPQAAPDPAPAQPNADATRVFASPLALLNPAVRGMGAPQGWQGTAITVMQIKQIISPGKMPAANRPPIETPISEP